MIYQKLGVEFQSQKNAAVFPYLMTDPPPRRIEVYALALCKLFNLFIF
jgi:hypothetical protein